MKTLIFGAGPLGSLYACLLHKSGKDVTILARNEHYIFLKDNGIVIILQAINFGMLQIQNQQHLI